MARTVHILLRHDWDSGIKYTSVECAYGSEESAGKALIKLDSNRTELSEYEVVESKLFE